MKYLLKALNQDWDNFPPNFLIKLIKALWGECRQSSRRTRRGSHLNGNILQTPTKSFTSFLIVLPTYSDPQPAADSYVSYLKKFDVNFRTVPAYKSQIDFDLEVPFMVPPLGCVTVYIFIQVSPCDQRL
jgi:hypothetical protein